MRRFFVVIFLSLSFILLAENVPYKLGCLIENPLESGIPVKEKIEPAKAVLDSVYNTDGLPPVGNQGSQGSCVGWSTGYYYMTYLQWEEKGWDVSIDSNIFSPAFVYHNINGGEDEGAFISDAYKLFQYNGCATLADMPYDETDFSSWPSEDTYKNATYYRVLTPYVTPFTSSTEFDNIKQHLANGHICNISIYVYSDFYYIDASNPFYSTSASSGTYYGGHAITVIGYNDSITTPDGQGAFLCINSWGTSWGDNGYFWITYQAMVNTDIVPYQYFYWADDRIGYTPTFWAGVKLTHDKNDQTRIIMGNSTDTVEFFNFDLDYYRDYWGYTDTVPYPSHPIIFDLTDMFIGSDTFFVEFYDTLTDSDSGSIDSFFVYDNTGNMAVSSDPIVVVPDNGYGVAKVYFSSSLIAYTSLSKDSVVFDYRSKNKEVSPIKINRVVNLYPIKTNMPQTKGDTTWLYWDDLGGVSNWWYGVNYWANIFYPERACTLIGITYARKYNNVTDTIMVKLDNGTNPGTEVYRDQLLLPDAGSGEIYRPLTTPVEITGPFWVCLYAECPDTSNMIGADGAGGDYSYFSSDGITWYNFASSGYSGDFIIRAQVVYTDLFSDSAVVYILNTDPQSQRSYTIDSLYTLHNSSWITYLDVENNVVPLSDSVPMIIGIDVSDLDTNSIYVDTVVVVTEADSLAKSVSLYLPVIVYTGNNTYVEKDDNNVSMPDVYVNRVSVFPNPATGVVNFVIPDNKEVDIEVFDVSGRIVKRFECVKNRFVWNAEDMNRGVYFIRFVGDNIKETHKLILK